MKKPKFITIILFIIAVAIYFVAPTIGLAVAALGILIELIAWVSWISGSNESKDKEI